MSEEREQEQRRGVLPVEPFLWAVLCIGLNVASFHSNWMRRNVYKLPPKEAV